MSRDQGPVPFGTPEPIEIPDYDVGDAIGRGGFGTVFRARHRVLQRDVAIKVLHAEYSRDPAAAARFVAEARAVNTIDHPAIVDVFDFGTLADGRQYYVMELLRGRTLRDVLRERERLPVAEAIPLLRAIASAVDAAHAAGIAHRDLKPDNIFILPDGGVKLIDFGLAKLTRNEDVPVTETGAVFGSPHYMSPEQCRGKAVTLATDAYSFGVLAYQVLTGELPFTGDALAIALQHLNDAPAPPSSVGAELPAHVDAAILALLVKEPAQRPMPLTSAVERMTGAAAPPAPRRSRAMIGVVALGVVAIGATVAIVATHRGSSTAKAPTPTPAPPAPPRWEGRALSIKLDSLSGEPTFTRDGTGITYFDRTATWRHDLATGARSLLVPDALRRDNARAVELPDGRWLLERTKPERAYLAIGDAATGEEKELVDGGMPSMSPDGAHVALVQDHWIAVHDVATGRTRRLAPTGDGEVFGPPRWSRDGAWLVWAPQTQPLAERRLQLTRVTDGLTRALPITIPGDWWLNPAAFLDDGRIVYYRDERSSSGVRWYLWAHDPASPTTDHDEKLVELPATTVLCLLDAAPGNRVAVAVRTSMQDVALIDVDRPVPEEHLLHREQSEHVVALDPVGRRAYAYTSGRIGMRAVVVGDGTPALVSYDLGTLARRDEPVCPDDRGLVWRAARIEHVEVASDANETIIRLRTHGDCALAQEWRLPAGSWAMPRCGAEDCFTLRVDGGSAEVVRLPAGAARSVALARFDAGTASFNPSLGVSPDGDRVVALAGFGGTVHVVDVRKGVARAYPMQGSPEGVAWSDSPTAFYVHGEFFDDTQFAIRRVELDGSTKLIWSSMFRQVFRLFADASGTRLAVALSTGQSDFWLFAPATGTRATSGATSPKSGDWLGE